MYYRLTGPLFCFRTDRLAREAGITADIASRGELVYLHSFFDEPGDKVVIERTSRPGFYWTAVWSACEDTFELIHPLKLLAEQAEADEES